MSDREIREQVQAGALDADDIADRCAAGARCGGCIEVVESLVAEGNSIRNRSTVAGLTTAGPSGARFGGPRPSAPDWSPDAG